MMASFMMPRDRKIGNRTIAYEWRMEMIRAFENRRTVTDLYVVTKDKNKNYRLEILITDREGVNENVKYKVFCSLEQAVHGVEKSNPPWELALSIMKALREGNHATGYHKPSLNDASYEAICTSLGRYSSATLTEILEEALGKDGIAVHENINTR